MRRLREVDHLDLLYYLCLILVSLVGLAMAIVLSSCSAPSIPDIPRRTPFPAKVSEPELVRVAMSSPVSAVREPVFIGKRRCGSVIVESDGAARWTACRSLRRLARRFER